MVDCIQEYKQLSYAGKKPLLVLNNKDFKVRNLITGINLENKDHKTNTKGKIIFFIIWQNWQPNTPNMT